MSFRIRLAAVCGALALLIAAFILGAVFSPQRMEERRSGAPLISLGPSPRIASVDVYSHVDDPAPLVMLQRKGANLWEASSGAVSYPGSSDRVETLLQGLLDLRRGNLVSSDPAKMEDLGLDPQSAHQVIIHAEGRPEVTLLVGKRAPSGDEEYVKLRGEPSAFLTRSSLGVLLSQDRSYWYELHVLPDDVQASTIASVTVSGSIRLGAPGEGVLQAAYTLVRAPGGQSNAWQIPGQKASVNPVAAFAMVNRVAQMEGIDFAGAAPASPPAQAARTAGGGFQILVVTLNGDRYDLRMTQGAEPGKLLLTTSWSPWTYVIDALTLAQTIFPLSDLLAGR